MVKLSTNSMRLYYIDKCSAFGPEEMKYNTRVLHSYSIQDGDELMVVPKTKWIAGVQLTDEGKWLTDRLIGLYLHWLTDQNLKGNAYGVAALWKERVK